MVPILNKSLRFARLYGWAKYPLCKQITNQAESVVNQWLKIIVTLNVQEENQWIFQGAGHSGEKEQNVPWPEARYLLEGEDSPILTIREAVGSQCYRNLQRRGGAYGNT